MIKLVFLNKLAFYLLSQHLKKKLLNLILIKMDAKLPKILLIAGTGWALFRRLTALNVYTKNTPKNKEIIS